PAEIFVRDLDGEVLLDRAQDRGEPERADLEIGDGALAGELRGFTPRVLLDRLRDRPDDPYADLVAHDLLVIGTRCPAPPRGAPPCRRDAGSCRSSSSGSRRPGSARSGRRRPRAPAPPRGGSRG